MAFLQRHTAIKTPHPAPVTPLTYKTWPYHRKYYYGMDTY